METGNSGKLRNKKAKNKKKEIKKKAKKKKKKKEAIHEKHFSMPYALLRFLSTDSPPYLRHFTFLLFASSYDLAGGNCGPSREKRWKARRKTKSIVSCL